MAEFTNLNIGDIVLVKYASKFSKDRFRLARILDLHPDNHGKVRTVTIGIRNKQRAARERRDVNRAGLVTMLVPVQRLVLVLPASEQPAELVEELLARVRGNERNGMEVHGDWELNGVHCTETWDEPGEQRQRRHRGLLSDLSA